MNKRRVVSYLTAVLAVCGEALGADQTARIKVATILPRGTSAHQALLEMAAKWRQVGVSGR